jgi:DNA-binding MarR family transcriptional regulator
VEFTILQLVAENDGITQKQLAQALALQPPHLTLLIDRLVERGAVARVRSEADRRAQIVCLTDDGRALADDTRQASLAMEDEVLARLSSGERALLFELLDKLAG